jgi:hypothetical protein
MRSSFWLCSILIAVFYPWGQRQTIEPCTTVKTDPYPVREVEPALREFGSELWISWRVKAISRLGDGASVAALKILEPEKLTEPDTTKAYLKVVRTAFSHPELISIQEDRDPKVTLFLLGWLKERIKSKDLNQAIQETELFVKSQTGNENPPPDRPPASPQ